VQIGKCCKLARDVKTKWHKTRHGSSVLWSLDTGCVDCVVMWAVDTGWVDCVTMWSSDKGCNIVTLCRMFLRPYGAYYTHSVYEVSCIINWCDGTARLLTPTFKWVAILFHTSGLKCQSVNSYDWCFPSFFFSFFLFPLVCAGPCRDMRHVQLRLVCGPVVALYMCLVITTVLGMYVE